MFLLNLIINTVSLSVYVESIAYPWISWRLLLEIKKSAVWNCQLYIYLFLAKLILKSQQKKNQISLILWRGVDRIWTGGYWCCRPLPSTLRSLIFTGTAAIFQIVVHLMLHLISAVTIVPQNLIYFKHFTLLIWRKHGISIRTQTN